MGETWNMADKTKCEARRNKSQARDFLAGESRRRERVLFLARGHAAAFLRRREHIGGGYLEAGVAESASPI